MLDLGRALQREHGLKIGPGWVSVPEGDLTIQPALPVEALQWGDERMPKLRGGPAKKVAYTMPAGAMLYWNPGPVTVSPPVV